MYIYCIVHTCTCMLHVIYASAYFFALSLKCKLQEETSLVLFTAVVLVLIIGSNTFQTLNHYLNKEGKNEIEKGKKDGKEEGQGRERGGLLPVSSPESPRHPRVTECNAYAYGRRHG